MKRLLHERYQIVKDVKVFAMSNRQKYRYLDITQAIVLCGADLGV